MIERFAREREMPYELDQAVRSAAAAGGDHQALHREPLLCALVSQGYTVRMRHPTAGETDLRVLVQIRVVHEAWLADDLAAGGSPVDQEQALLIPAAHEHDEEV